MKILPDFAEMARFYRGDGWLAEDIKKSIGGTVNQPEIDDTCIVRLSEPLNAAGHSIPRWTMEFRTRQGTDKRWYGLRVKEFWEYMFKTYGDPTVGSARSKKTKHTIIKREEIQKMRGIIGFRVHFKGATGHFTLWDGHQNKLLYGEKDHDYFAIHYDAAIWEAGDQLRMSQPDV